MVLVYNKLKNSPEYLLFFLTKRNAHKIFHSSCCASKVFGINEQLHVRMYYFIFFIKNYKIFTFELQYILECVNEMPV